MKTRVVILNWNGRPMLQKYLPSVVATLPTGVALTVADNGSTDDSVEWLTQNYPDRVEVLRLPENYGYAGGYRRALEMLDDELFILLNSDVEPTEGWCQTLVSLFENDSSVGAAAPKILSWADRGAFEYAGASGGFIDYFGYPFCRGRILSCIERDCGQYDDRREVFWASGACLAVRADALRAVGSLDESFFAHMEEIDLCWRLWSAGWRVMVEPSAVVYHLGGGTLPNNSPRKLYLNFRNSLAMIYKNLRGWALWRLWIRMVLDGGSALVYLLSGKWDYFKAVWQAHRDFRRMKRSGLRNKRRAAQELAVASPSGIYRGSILLRYLFGTRKFGRLL